MSGIKSTSGGAPPPIDTAKGSASSQQQVAPVSPSSPSGGGSGPAVPQASSISHLTEGSTIAAIVTARATGGDAILHAEIGNFRMTTNSPPPVGTHVVLEVEAIDDVIVARLIAVNGEKLPSPPTAVLLPTLSTSNIPTVGTYGNGGPPPTSILPEALQNLTATLGKSDASLPSPSTQQAGALSQTAQTSSRYGHVSVPIPAIGPAETKQASSPTATGNTAAYSQTPSPGLRSVTAPLHQIPQNSGIPYIQINSGIIRATLQTVGVMSSLNFPSGTAAMSPGTQLTLLSTAQTSQSPVNIPSAATAVNGIVSSVAGVQSSTHQGLVSRVTVQAGALGSLQYSTTIPPQVGAHVSYVILEELQLFPLSNAPLTTGIFKAPHLPILSNWENLQSAFNLLASQDPALASNLLNSRIPSPNTQLGASLLFFLTALNGGSIDKWLGQDFRRTLETAGGRDLMRRLDDDFSTFIRLASDNGGQDWKILPFPFHQDGMLRQLRMFYRHNKREDGHPEDSSTRFVIELDLSRTGPVQLDGLFKKARFDLVFRSHLPIPDGMQNKVLALFTENLEITGIKGQLRFQRTQPFPVHPTEEWESSGPDIIET